MSGLAEDMELVLAPVRQMAKRLSVAERFALEQACDQALAMCKDEEEQAAITADLLNDAISETEDR